MRCLPSLDVGDGRQRLLMADRSAAVLGNWLLSRTETREGRGANAQAALEEALTEDPPLLVWAVLVAESRDVQRPRRLADVAGRLTPHALDVPGWVDGECLPAVREAEARAYGQHVAFRFSLAELATHIQAAENASDTQLEELRLASYLYRPHEWFGESESPGFSTWSLGSEGVSLSRVVELAAAILRGECSLPEGIDITVDAARARAEARCRAWLAEEDDSLISRLPTIASRMARLVTLTERFDETLESEKLESMAEFAAGAGHEINNPLAVIAGRAQLFLRDEEDPERRRALALMNAQAKRVYEMVADMMLFARPPEIECQTVDVRSLIDEVIRDMTPLSTLHEITISLGEDVVSVEVEVDPTQLQVALRAICQNAIEAIGREGRIEIGVACEGGDVTISISDDGPGIVPEERRHLFDPYYSARQAGRGLGLGLSKAWRIVTNHGGRIDAENNRGDGATFSLVLPKRR